MPSISYERFAAWSNYHLTRGDDPDAFIPAMTIDEIGRVHAGDVDAMGIERFGRFADKLLEHLRHLKKRFEGDEPPDRPAAGLVGQGWSFSALIGTRGGQLICNGMVGVTQAARHDLGDAWKPKRDRLAFALGGTRLREIAVWAEANKLSLATSGTHLGPTIAGGFGTASHGSKLNYGGLQDMVVGMHLVTGEDKHVWIERAGSPVLSDAGVAKLSAGGAGVKVIRDDAVFDDALIHLGAMGIVVGVALELEPKTRFAKMVVEQGIGTPWLEAIAAGDHKGLAGALGCKSDPLFHELTIDPMDPLGKSAIHTMYFRRKTPGGAKPKGFVSPADAIGAYVPQLWETALLEQLVETAMSLEKAKPDPGDEPDPPTLRDAMRVVLQGARSAYGAYRDIAQPAKPGKFDPEGADTTAGTWSEIHNSDTITGDIPGILYNASFAVLRADTARAVTAITDAVQAARLPAVFVFTLRFVTEAAGSLAFTRFRETTVIEIDGASKFACKLALRHLQQSPNPPSQKLADAILWLGEVLPTGARAVRAALASAGIDYSMHWAKLGDLDRQKVLADYAKRLPRWRRTRDGLLTAFGRKVFWNEAVLAYGLLDPPPV